MNEMLNKRIIEAARKAWEQAADMRARRDRYKRFTYGDQWSDIIVDADGQRLTERACAAKYGKEPLTNNLIRRLVKCVVGRFRMWLSDNNLGESSSGAMREICRRNCLDELDSRALEEFLISGMAVQRVTNEYRPAMTGPLVENVNPRRFFVNAVSDPRGIDIEMVGMLHDMSEPEVVMRFAGADRLRARKLRQMCRRHAGDGSGCIADWPARSDVMFDRCDDRSRCRLVEVWTLESRSVVKWHDMASGRCGETPEAASAWIDAENAIREKKGALPVDTSLTHTTAWHCRWLVPDGELVAEYDSPFAHRGHPFVVKMYPLTDGEVHSLVEDVIDQQKYVNRLITLLDRVMSVSAKGVLLFPVDQKIKEMNWHQLAAAWASPDGVIPYAGREDIAEPRQVTTNAGDFGARQLLSLQMQMLEDVSGVNGALLGRSSGGGNVGYERYESEVRNATVAINDLLLTFANFRSMRDDKLLNL